MNEEATVGQFEEDTAVTPLGDNRWQGELKRGWRIGSVPNGGYVLAVIGRALRNTMPHKDPPLDQRLLFGTVLSWRVHY